MKTKMKTKRILIMTFLTVLLPLTALADIWQDPETKVNYEYTIGKSEACVKRGTEYMAGSPYVSGNISICSKFEVDGNEYFVDKIDMYAFVNCTNLTGIVIPEGIVRIEGGAFSGCTGLISINIPSSVNSMNYNPFVDCRELEEITVEEGNAVYDSRNNCNAIISTKYNQLWVGCKTTIIPLNVNSIAPNAFSGNTNLTSISVPSSVKAIGATAFAGCTGLENIMLSEGLTEIGESAFGDCSNLSSISIPASVITIRERAFSGCSSLSTIAVDVNNVIFDSRDNCNAIINTKDNELKSGCKTTIIPSSVTSIGSFAFERQSGLASIDIPSSITAIGFQSFINCNNLSNITFHEGLISIGDGAFYGCPLRDIDLPSSVKHMGSNPFGLTAWHNVQSNGLLYLDGWLLGYKNTKPKGDITINEGTIGIASSAFESCYDLTNITIPPGMKSIGNSVFSYCSGLTSVVIPSSVSTMGSLVFQSCSGLKSVIISEGVTALGENTFNGCESLVSITIPSSVMTIGTGTFAYCYKLADINLVEGLTYIGRNAFLFCRDLTSITLPSSITTIDENAFAFCTNISSVTSLIRNPNEINRNVFEYYDDGLGDLTFTSATLYVPKGTKEKYEATSAWNQFQNIIELDDIPTGVDADITSYDEDTVTECYGLNGLRRNCRQRGLNIVRMSDGTVKKVAVR